MLPTKWLPALLDVDVDPDATEEVDLEGNYEFLTVIIPTLGQSSKLEAQIAMASEGTFYPVWHWDADAAGDFLGQTSSVTTTRAITFNIGGAQFVKVGVEGTNMSTDVTFYVRGFNRS
ncbi:hypothetical protein LCGC14_0392780 [marine sediment metagenome]|uniref:Uncharacterized protein n=1 Tax=marine sediment metagenome TaxID=412755 RepID=A0A0F9TH12_9ZZZZ